MKKLVIQMMIEITLVIKDDFIVKTIALIDSTGADMNCIKEGSLPTEYIFHKTKQNLSTAEC